MILADMHVAICDKLELTILDPHSLEIMHKFSTNAVPQSISCICMLGKYTKEVYFCTTGAYGKNVTTDQTYHAHDIMKRNRWI